MNTLNVSHAGKWRINFSNIPSVSNVTDLKLYENFCKSISIPDQNLDIDEVYDHNIKRFSINAKPNTNLSDFQITFKITEDMLNYYNLLEYLLQLKSGKVSTETLKENIINNISLTSLDNNKRKRGILSFKNCLIHSISSFSLEYGTAEENQFTTNWLYEHLIYEKVAI
jgi:SUMO ligase MMS21 Smc5/6 complex component